MGSGKMTRNDALFVYRTHFKKGLYLFPNPEPEQAVIRFLTFLEDRFLAFCLLQVEVLIYG